MNEKETLIWLSSIRSITNKTLDTIENYFDDIRFIWKANSSDIGNMTGISQKIKDDILKYRNERYVEELFSKIEKYKVNILSINDDNYPKNLKNIYSPPRILYIRGNILENDNISIAIVGSRKATNYGKWASEKFARELSNLGITIVSGMARGIDSFAHKGALSNNGRSLAVLGSGVDVIYPKTNKQLYNELMDKGGVISEYPLGMEPLPYNFPRRNRIISGLSLGVVVIEAKEKSGSLITTEHALEQGKEVFALPGNINSIYSLGTHKLIKEGCKLTTNIEDIIEEINLLKDLKSKQKKEMKNENLSDIEERIVKLISQGPIHCDMISLYTNTPISELISILTILEMKKIIKQLPGKIFTLN